MAKHFLLIRPPLVLYGYGIALALLLLRVQMVFGRSIQLDRRGASTNAVCREDFGWMNNSLSQSPCLVAAYLLAPCQRTGDGNVQAINTTYLAPTAEGAEACWCSWGVYNTLEACAACQNNLTYLLSWYNYRTNCSSDLQPNTEFYPSDNAISDETAVPFWATADPSTWDSGTFNVSQAQAIANEGKEDITQANRGSSGSATGTGSASSSGTSAASTETSGSDDNGSSTNVGAIAGGVAGGVVALAAIGLLAFFFMRRKKKTEGQWDYKEPDMTVSPLVTSEVSGNGSRPLIGGYTDFGQPGNGNIARIQTASNLRVDLASPVHEGNASATYYSGSSGYDNVGGHAFTVASSSSTSGAGPQPNVVYADPSPPPYSDTGAAVPPPPKGR